MLADCVAAGWVPVPGYAAVCNAFSHSPFWCGEVTIAGYPAASVSDVLFGLGTPEPGTVLWLTVRETYEL